MLSEHVEGFAVAKHPAQNHVYSRIEYESRALNPKLRCMHGSALRRSCSVHREGKRINPPRTPPQICLFLTFRLVHSAGGARTEPPCSSLSSQWMEGMGEDGHGGGIGVPSWETWQVVKKNVSAIPPRGLVYATGSVWNPPQRRSAQRGHGAARTGAARLGSPGCCSGHLAPNHTRDRIAPTRV